MIPHKTRPSPDSVCLLATVGAIMLWSTSFVGTKLAYDSFPPITLGALRFTAASLLLGVIVVIRGGCERLEKGDVKTVALSGFLGITLYFAMENIGVALTSASNAALIVASYPAITALLERILYKVPVSRLQASGIAMAMAGVFILTHARDGFTGPNEFLGNLILFATGFVWALYNFTARKVVNKYSATTFALYQTSAGALFFLPLTLFEASAWRVPTINSVIVLLYLALLCSVAAFMLYNFGLRRLSSTAAVSLMNLVPVFGVLCSVLILGEAVTTSQISGGIIVIGGVLLSLRKPTPVTA